MVAIPRFVRALACAVLGSLLSAQQPASPPPPATAPVRLVYDLPAYELSQVLSKQPYSGRASCGRTTSPTASASWTD